MEIVHVDDGRYSEYESLLLERDRYRKEADLTLREYIRVFGDLIMAVFKQKIACIEKKKMLSLCLMYFNRGEHVDIKKVNEQIRVEMADYQKQLDAMIADNETCKQMKRISESEVLRIRQIYRKIAKRLHPDLNPLTEQHEELLHLWMRNITAYQCNDLKELEVLVDLALSALGEGKTVLSVPDIQEKIDALQREIAQIRSTDPYRYREILVDENLVCEKKKALEEECNEYQRYAQQLEQELKRFIMEGGTFTWTN